MKKSEAKKSEVKGKELEVGDIVRVVYNEYFPPLPIESIEVQCGIPYYRISDRSGLWGAKELKLCSGEAVARHSGFVVIETASTMGSGEPVEMGEALSDAILDKFVTEKK